MKINHQQTGATKMFKDIELGEVFLYHGCPYIKVQSQSFALSYCLIDGTPLTCPSHEFLRVPKKSELIIEE